MSSNRILLYNSTANKSAGTARNIGLHKARGKWLLFSDADDFFLPNAFDKCRELADSDSDIIYFLPKCCYLGTTIYSPRLDAWEKLITDYLACSKTRADIHPAEIRLRYQYTGPVSRMIRYSIVKNAHIHFDEVPVWNDVMFSLKTAYAARQISANENPIYCCTDSGVSLVSRFGKEYSRSRASVYCSWYQFLHKNLSKSDLSLLDDCTPQHSKRLLAKELYSGADPLSMIKMYLILKQHHIPIQDLEISDIPKNGIRLLNYMYYKIHGHMRRM